MKYRIFANIVCFLLFVMFPANISAMENDFGTPEKIQANDTIGREVNNIVRDRYSYVFTVNETGCFSYEIHVPSSADQCNNITAGLYDSEGKEITSMKFTGSEIIASNQEYIGKSPDIGISAGTYYLKIETYLKSQLAHLSYTLKTGFSVGDDWEAESNDTIDAATKITLEKECHGAITNRNPDEADFYQFLTDSNGTVSIRFSKPLHTSASTLYIIDLYNEKEELIYSTDIAGKETEIITPKISVPAGSYYVKIHGAPTASAILPFDTYTICVSHTSVEGWELEPNDTMSAAMLLPMEETRYGVTDDISSKEHDYYTFTVEEDGVYAIYCNRYDGQPDKSWSMCLTDSQGEELQKDYFGEKEEHYILVSLKKGTYYLDIYSTSVRTLCADTYSVKIRRSSIQELQDTCAHSYTEEKIKSTYFKKGYTVFTCEKCNYQYKGKFKATKKLPEAGYEKKEKYKGTTVTETLKLSCPAKVDGYELVFCRNQEFKKVKKMTVKKRNAELKFSGYYEDMGYAIRYEVCYFKIRAFLKSGKKTVYSKWSNSTGLSVGYNRIKVK